MPDAITLLSLLESCLYGCVVMCASVAAFVAPRRGERPWHKLAWACLAGVFAVFMILRIMNTEEIVREYFRAGLSTAGEYNRRRDFQRPIVAGLIVLAGFSGLWWATFIYRSMADRLKLVVLAALSAGVGMVILMILRLVSLHAIDALLYGPAKLNWFADVGLSCLVAGAAIYYTKLIRGAS